MIIVSKFSLMSGPEFYYEAPTNESFGAGPYGVIDPYERKGVHITQSTIPESGEGVIALRDFPAERCTCFCSGFFYDLGEEAQGYDRRCTYNESLTMDERRNCKKYSLIFDTFATIMNIPPEMDKPGMFQPTAGPKVFLHLMPLKLTLRDKASSGSTLL
jgi:hypothetical protein